MVNIKLKEYFEKNLKNYSFEELKQSALKSGYSEDQIDEIQKLNLNNKVNFFYLDNKINKVIIFFSIIVFILNFFLLKNQLYLLVSFLIIGLIINLRYFYKIKIKISFKYLLFTLFISSIYSTLFYLLFIFLSLYIIKILNSYFLLLYIPTIFGVIFFSLLMLFQIILYYILNNKLLELFYGNLHSKEFFFYNSKRNIKTVLTFLFILFFILSFVSLVYHIVGFKLVVNSNLKSLKDSIETAPNYIYYNPDYNKSNFNQNFINRKEEIKNDKINKLNNAIKENNKFNFNNYLDINFPTRYNLVIQDDSYLFKLGSAESYFFYMWNTTYKINNSKKEVILSKITLQNEKLLKKLNLLKLKQNEKEQNDKKYYLSMKKNMNILPLDMSLFEYYQIAMQNIFLNNKKINFITKYEFKNKNYKLVDDKLNQELLYQSYLLKNVDDYACSGECIKDIFEIFKNSDYNNILCKYNFPFDNENCRKYFDIK